MLARLVPVCVCVAVLVALPAGAAAGGGATSPDLVVTGSAGVSAPSVGDVVPVSIAVTDANAQPAQSLLVAVALSSGLQYVSSYADRGPGCAATSLSALTCNLDWLSAGAPVGHIQMWVRVTAGGTQTVTATATSQQGIFSSTDNSIAISLLVPFTTSSGSPLGLNGNGSGAVADRTAPTAHALASAGRLGGSANLRFRIYDNSGIAKATVTIRRADQVVATRRSGFGPVAYGSVYFVAWAVPRTAPPGTYSFCVVATDRSGNSSARSCAPLALR